MSEKEIAGLRDDVIEQATEACAGGGPHHEGLMKAVLAYLIACGDEELAAHIAAGSRLYPASPPP